MSKLGAFGLGALAGAVLVAFLDWRAGAGYRERLKVTQAASAASAEVQAIQSAEIARLEADNRRLLVIAETPDTVQLPAPRPRPGPVVTPPDYAGVVAKLDSVAAQRDSLWEDSQKLRAAVAWRDNQIAAYVNVVARKDSIIGLRESQNDSLTSDVARWKKQAESAPSAQLPSFGFGKTVDCAIGAAAGALVGELAKAKPLVTLSAAGVGCVVNALR